MSGFREKLNILTSEITLKQFNALEYLQENIRTAVIGAQPKTLAQAFEIASAQEINVFHIDNRERRNYNNYRNSEKKIKF